MLPSLLSLLASSSIHWRLTHCFTITSLLNPLVLSRHWAWYFRILAQKNSRLLILLSRFLGSVVLLHIPSLFLAEGQILLNNSWSFFPEFSIRHCLCVFSLLFFLIYHYCSSHSWSWSCLNIALNIWDTSVIFVTACHMLTLNYVTNKAIQIIHRISVSGL